MSDHIIYALHHDESDYVYIGKSSKGIQRPKDHGKVGNLNSKSHLPVVRWIRKRRSTGQDYQISILEEHDSAESLNDSERFYIAYFRSLGIPLLNCTDGGDGSVGLTPEIRARISEARKGRKLSEEHKKKIAEGVRVAVSKPSYSANMSAIKKGIPHSKEHNIALSSAAHKRSTDEYKKRMSDTLSGRKLTESAKMSMRGIKHKSVCAAAIESGVIPSVVKEWRIALGMSGRLAAKVLGSGRTAFQRFEAIK